MLYKIGFLVSNKTLNDSQQHLRNVIVIFWFNLKCPTKKLLRLDTKSFIQVGQHKLEGKSV